MSKITVLGGGGWLIALAMVLNDNGHNVTIWSAVNREVEALKTHREKKFGSNDVQKQLKLQII